MEVFSPDELPWAHALSGFQIDIVEPSVDVLRVNQEELWQVDLDCGTPNVIKYHVAECHCQ